MGFSMVEPQKGSREQDTHVQEVIRAAQRELRELLRERAEIMKRIGTVKQTIVGLANMFGDDVLDEEMLDLVDRRGNGLRLEREHTASPGRRIASVHEQINSLKAAERGRAVVLP